MTAFVPPLFPLPRPPHPRVALLLAVNVLVRREPWAQQALLAHQGKTALLAVGAHDLAFTVNPEGALAAAHARVVPDVTIRLPAEAWTAFLQSDSRAVFRLAKVEGDAQFAQTISTLAQNLRWDVEEDLSRVVGDVAARRLAQGATLFINEAKRSAEKLAESVAEYYLDEQQQLVRPREVQQFSEAVRALRDDLARLEKRILRQERPK